MKITPFILGHGRAGNSIWEAFAFLRNQMPEITWIEPVWVERNLSLRPATEGLSIACIAIPNALHADRIIEASRAGFQGIITEKPSCTSLDQASKLSEVLSKVAVLHVYRQMWGPQEIKKMLLKSYFGQIVSIEGRYWQSSATVPGSPSNWKNNPQLIGPSDAVLDVGIHWLDLVTYLMGKSATSTTGWVSRINAEAPHRDTHAHLTLNFDEVPTFGSISKTFHGATNNLEIHIIGAKASASWSLLSPDEIVIGEGRDRRVLTRKTAELGGHKPPFHGLGWLEGYIEIIRQLTLDVLGKPCNPYPTLHENVRLVEAVLKSKILERR